MSEHKYIWLQPECCADPDEGRHWCQDPDPVECDDGKLWTKYILASEHEALERQLAEAREPMCAVCAGDKEAAKRINCICDGIGTQWGELEGMRGELQKTIAELESATAELTLSPPVQEDVHTETNCPTCGSAVKVGGDGETHYYIPITRPAQPDVVETIATCNQAILLAIEELMWDQKYGVTLEGESRQVDEALRLLHQAKLEIEAIWNSRMMNASKDPMRITPGWLRNKIENSPDDECVEAVNPDWLGGWSISTDDKKQPTEAYIWSPAGELVATVYTASDAELIKFAFSNLRRLVHEITGVEFESCTLKEYREQVSPSEIKALAGMLLQESKRFVREHQMPDEWEKVEANIGHPEDPPTPPAKGEDTTQCGEDRTV